MKTVFVMREKPSMGRLAAIAIGGVIVGALSVGAPAEAAWPESGVRAISGTACRKPVAPPLSFAYCLYPSDDIYGAVDNTRIYADYQVTGSASSVTTAAACFVRYYGGTAMCGTAASATGPGFHDVALTEGLGELVTTYGASQYDYFFVNIAWDFTTPQATIGTINGVDFSW